MSCILKIVSQVKVLNNNVIRHLIYMFNVTNVIDSIRYDIFTKSFKQNLLSIHSGCLPVISNSFL